MIPTELETKQAISSLPETSLQDRKFKLALKYIYLTACRLAEVFGPHSPQGKHADITTIDGKKAVLFAIKTARRGGKYRAIAVPFDDEWAQELHSHFRLKNNLEVNPFDISENDDTSRKYLQKCAEELFDSKKHLWKRDAYPRYFPEVARDEHIICERNITGQLEYLIQDEDKSRTWRNKKTRAKVVWTVDQPKKFRIKHLREQRHRELVRKYKFSDVQARQFLGLKQEKSASMIVDIDEIEPIQKYNFDKLIELASKYFPQFHSTVT